MQTKTDQARQALQRGDHKTALRIVARFQRVTREQHVAITRAYEMLVRPEFYIQLGFDPQSTVDTGLAHLKEVLA